MAGMRTMMKLKPQHTNIAERHRKMSEARLLNEMKMWRPFRLFGLFAALMGLCFTVVVIFDKHWLDWQNAVIGLLIFSVAFGFLAIILSICGVCTSTLTKKIYYYHSAGEIYFICALSCIGSLMIYPLGITLENRIGLHTYGYGYGLGWGAAIFFFAAAMCMCLDDVVRAVSKGFCCCKKKKANSTV